MIGGPEGNEPRRQMNRTLVIGSPNSPLARCWRDTARGALGSVRFVHWMFAAGLLLALFDAHATRPPPWVGESLAEAVEAPEATRVLITMRLADADTHEEAFWSEIVLGSLDRRAGRFGAAIESLRSAEQRARRNRSPDLVARASTDLGIAFAQAGFADDALDYLQAAHRYYESRGDVERASALLSNIASTLGEAGRFEAAAGYLDAGLALKAANGITAGLGALYNNRALIALENGDLETAALNLDEALRRYREDEDRRGQAMTFIYRARLLAERIDPSALDALDQAREVLPAGQNRVAALLEETAARGQLAMARRADANSRGDVLDRAAASAAAAAAAAEQMDDPRRQARVARLASEIARERGDLAGALEQLQRSIDADAALAIRLDARRMDVLDARYRFESAQRELAEARTQGTQRLAVILVVTLIAAGLLGFALLQRGRSAAYQRLSETDVLTELPNRRSAVQRLDAEIDHPADPDELAVAILDLDYFKAVNDRYGHDVGDRVLQAVAAELVQRSDARIFVARFGGEEFIAVFNGRDRNAVVQWCESARSAIGHLSFDGYPMLRVTASLGVGFAADLAQREVKELTRAADNALYLAKREGRDRMAVAGNRRADRPNEPEYTGERRRKADRTEPSPEA